MDWWSSPGAMFMDRLTCSHVHGQAEAMHVQPCAWAGRWQCDGQNLCGDMLADWWTSPNATLNDGLTRRHAHAQC
eukprot:3988708-Lingulodinium_polyedra.AAC.1